MRSAVRLLGLIFLAAALALASYDAITSLSDGLIRVTKLGDVWFGIHQNSLQLLQPAIERHVAVWLWDPVMLSILTSPTWLVLGAIGIILVLLGRKKKPLIGYARR